MIVSNRCFIFNKRIKGPNNIKSGKINAIFVPNDCFSPNNMI